jgi:hypothetical protein
MEQVGALTLEVDTLSRSVGGNEDANGVVGRIEGVLDLFASFLVHAPVQNENAILDLRLAHDGLELVQKVILGVGVLRKDENSPAVPLEVGLRLFVGLRQIGALMLANPAKKASELCVWQITRTLASAVISSRSVLALPSSSAVAPARVARATSTSSTSATWSSVTSSSWSSLKRESAMGGSVPFATALEIDFPAFRR